MNATDFRRIGGPLPLDLWLDLSAFVEAWEPDELPFHMVCLGAAPPEDAATDFLDGDHTQRHLGEIVRCLEEHQAELRKWRDAEVGAERRAMEEELAEAAELKQRVRDVLASIAVTTKGGDA